MIIFNKILEKWAQLMRLGIKEGMPIELVVKTRLLNTIYYSLTFWNVVLLIFSLFAGNPMHALAITINIIYNSTIFGLNIKGKHFAAWFLLTFGYTVYLALFWIFVDSAWNPAYMYMLIIFLALIAFRKRTQFLVVSSICLIYILLPWLGSVTPDAWKVTIETFPNFTEISFWICLTISSAFLHYYQTEIRKNRNAQRQTIDDLQNSNRHFQDIKNELEQFIQVTSGELQRKLIIIQQQVSKIKQLLTFNKAEETVAFFKIADASAQQMYFWVNDILEFSNLSQQSPQIETVNLKSLVEEIISELQIEKARIEYQNLPTLQMNYQEIKVVFQHLIENSLRYNHAEMPILKINSTVLEDRMSIIFKNNGKGISEKYEEQILKNYKRIHNYDTYEGIGLGLGIAEKIAGKLGGHIEVETEERNKTIYTLQLKRQ